MSMTGPHDYSKTKMCVSVCESEVSEKSKGVSDRYEGCIRSPV